jgi:hypothetical protein
MRMVTLLLSAFDEQQSSAHEDPLEAFTLAVRGFHSHDKREREIVR